MLNLNTPEESYLKMLEKSTIPNLYHPDNLTKDANVRNTDEFNMVWVQSLKNVQSFVDHFRYHVNIKYEKSNKMWTHEKNLGKGNHEEVEELKALGSDGVVNWVLCTVSPVSEHGIFGQVVAIFALGVSLIGWLTWGKAWLHCINIGTLKNANVGCLEIEDVCENDKITPKRNIFTSVCKFWTKICFQAAKFYLYKIHRALCESELILVYSFDVSPRSKNNQNLCPKQFLAANSLLELATAHTDDCIGGSSQSRSISSPDANLGFHQTGLSTVLWGQEQKNNELHSAAGFQRSNTLQHFVHESRNLVNKFERTDTEKADFNMIISDNLDGSSLSASSETLQGTNHHKTDKDINSSQGEGRRMSFLKFDSSSFSVDRTLQLISVTLMPVRGIPWREFERETMRLASFALYPENACISPNLLAGAGFVYIGDGRTDLVRCFFCSAEKESWRSTDNVDDVHMHLSPFCPIVSIRSLNNTVTNVSALTDVSGYSSAVPVRDADISPSAATCLSQDTETAVECVDEVDFNTSSHEARDNSSVNFDSSERARVANGDAARPLGSSAQPSLGMAVNNSIINPPSFQDRGAEFLHSGSGGWLQAGPLDVAGHNDDNVQHESSEHYRDRETPASNNVVSSRSATEPQGQERQGQERQGQEHQDQESEGQEPQSSLLINSQIYRIPSGDTTEAGSTSAPATSNQPDPQSQTSVAVTYQTLGIFRERPKHPDFAVLARRIASFDGWPTDHALRIEDLASSGLFYTGYGDCCKCFFCGGGLRNWEKDDHPLVEHARWFPKCGFLLQTLGAEFIQAVQELKSTNGPITMGQVLAKMGQKQQIPLNHSDNQRLTDDAAVKSLLESGYNKQEVVRVAASLRQEGELLSADLILRRLRTPSSLGASEIQGAEGGSTDSTEDERLHQLKEQNFILRNNLLCKICMDREVCTVFLPCGHLVCCNECALAMQDCPVCRRHIRATARALIR